jgi:hypothetical protein
MPGPLTRYVESVAPQPTQVSLDEMLRNVARVRVFAGGMNWDEPMEQTVLAEITDAGQIYGLKAALRIVDGSGGHCMCDGDPTLELLDDDGRRLAVLGLHHGVSLRWSAWKDDARFAGQNGMELLLWLEAAGVAYPMDEFMEETVERDLAERAWNAWLGAMPQALRDLPDATWRKVLEKGDLFPLLAALVKAYPDANARALALFAWHAHGGLAWSGYPTYENISAALLAQFPEKDLVAIVERADLDGAQLHGAARFFACNEPGRVPPLPQQGGPTGEVVSIPQRSAPLPPMSVSLRAALLGACLNGTDDDGRERAEAAYLGAEDRRFLAAVRARRPAPLMVLPTEVAMAECVKPEALAAFLSAIDRNVPQALGMVLRFEVGPAGVAGFDIELREEDKGKEPTVRTALAAVPKFNATKGNLRFACWYASVD